MAKWRISPRCFGEPARRHCLRRLGAAFGEALDEAALRARFIVGLAWPALRTGPAIVHEVEHDAVGIEEFHLILRVVAVIGLAHDPTSAMGFDVLLGPFDIVDPNTEMMQADEIFALALGGLIGFVGEERHAEDAVGEEDAFREARIRLARHLQPENAFVEFRRQPWVAHRHGDVTKLAHRSSSRLPAAVCPHSAGERGIAPSSSRRPRGGARGEARSPWHQRPE
jgi:hypothetical protein